MLILLLGGQVVIRRKKLVCIKIYAFLHCFKTVTSFNTPHQFTTCSVRETHRSKDMMTVFIKSELCLFQKCCNKINSLHFDPCLCIQVVFRTSNILTYHKESAFLLLRKIIVRIVIRRMTTIATTNEYSTGRGSSFNRE